GRGAARAPGAAGAPARRRGADTGGARTAASVRCCVGALQPPHAPEASRREVRWTLAIAGGSVPPRCEPSREPAMTSTSEAMPAPRGEASRPAGYAIRISRRKVQRSLALIVGVILV